MAAKRGKCSRCGYSFRLKVDGTVQRHRLYVYTSRVWCDEADFLNPVAPITDEGYARAASDMPEKLPRSDAV